MKAENNKITQQKLKGTNPLIQAKGAGTFFPAANTIQKKEAALEDGDLSTAPESGVQLKKKLGGGIDSNPYKSGAPLVGLNKEKTAKGQKKDEGKQEDTTEEGEGLFDRLTEQIKEQANELARRAEIVAGARTLGFEEYVSSVARLEALAAADGLSKTEIISAFRKLYYNSGNWDTVIEGAKDTAIPASWRATANLAFYTNVRRTQVVTINGEAVDVGHLLTGIDAGNYEGAFSLKKGIFTIFSFRSNKEFATFVGDLGSVVEAYVDENNSVRDDASLAAHYNQLAGDPDMAGNVDSYSMPYDISNTFAQNLMSYYTGASRGDDRRYTTFAQNIGLGTLTGGEFSGDNEEFRDGLEGEVYEFAKAFQMRNGIREGVGSWGGLIPYSTVSGWVVDYFINDLKAKVNAEAGN